MIYGLLLVLALVLFQEKWLYKIFFTCLYIAIRIFAEIMPSFLLQYAGLIEIKTYWQHPGLYVLTLLGIYLQHLAYLYVVAPFWQKRSRRLSHQDWLIFVLIPAAEILMLIGLIDAAMVAQLQVIFDIAFLAVFVVPLSTALLFRGIQRVSEAAENAARLTIWRSSRGCRWRIIRP